MANRRTLELSVGIFLIVGIAAFVMLALKVSGLTQLSSNKQYNISANFTNIGGLKVRAPVTIAGVRVGEVSKIKLLPGSFNARVTLSIHAGQDRIPYYDTSARILTEGLLGSNYISIVPGFDTDDDDDNGKGKARYLKQGDVIEKTQEAVILENLIGQLIFNMNK